MKADRTFDVVLSVTRTVRVRVSPDVLMTTYEQAAMELALSPELWPRHVVSKKETTKLKRVDRIDKAVEVD